MIKQLVENRESDLENSKQYDVSEASAQVGLPFTVYITSKVQEELVNPDEEALKKGESKETRLNFVLNKLIQTIRSHRKNSRLNYFHFNVSLTNDGKSKDYLLLSYLGPKTVEDRTPCVTLLDPLEIEENQSSDEN